MADFQGTTGADAFIGTDEADRFLLSGGADTVSAAAGDDLVVLGEGDARAAFGTIVDGGEGEDTLDGSATTANLRIFSPLVAHYGIPGIVATNFEIIRGGAGDDLIALPGETAPLLIDAGEGNDLVLGGWGDDVIDGGSGNDLLSGGIGTDLVQGGAGDDHFVEVRLAASWGGVTLEGGEGIDTAHLVGISAEIDLMAGGGTLSGASVAMSGVENVTLYGRGQTFTVRGDEGANVLAVGAMFTDATTAAVLDGRGGEDVLIGGRGDDTLLGGAGNDLLAGRRGVNLIDGGEGDDVLLLAGSARDYTVLRTDAGWTVRYQESCDTLVGVERVSFDGGASATDLAAFSAESFNAFGYLASYADLRAAFGTDVSAARAHWNTFGQAEQRDPGLFDARLYGASNADVAAAYGNDPHLLARHYVVYGIGEARPVTGFDALDYAASNPDLVRVIGLDTEALLDHYLDNGAREGRPVAAFDPWTYAASNLDVAEAFGADPDAIRGHYLSFGIDEARPTTGFDALAYAAVNPDLARAFGDDPVALARHYVTHGQYEDRVLSGFDEVGYLLSNPDLVEAGVGPDDALRHWVKIGVDSHPEGDGRFGREQAGHALVVDGGADGAIETPGDRDWFAIDLAAGTTISFDAHATDGSGAALSIAVHDSAGRQLFADADGQFDFTPTAEGSYYLVVASASDVPIDSYRVDALHWI